MTTTEFTRTSTIELEIDGMTCASCANRIERKLNKLAGVTATVNYATERASVEFPTELGIDTLLSTVRAAGYGANPPPPPAEDPTRAAGPEDAHGAELRDRFVISAALGLPVLALAMVPAWQFPAWQWFSLALASVVVLVCGWPFHRAAAVNLRHGTTTMDTLVSLGVAVAYLWSVYALVFGDAGALGMRHEFSLLPRTAAGGDVYLEVAVGVTTFLLLGRWLEARSKRRAGAALRALLALGAKNVAVLRDGGELRIPVAALAEGERFVVRPGEKVAADGVVVEGTSAIDRSVLTGESVPEEVGPGAPVVGGTVNAGGRLVVLATRVGADTQLAHMARLVEQAQTGKAKVQRLADRIASVFVPVVVGIAVLTAVGWLLAGRPVEFAMTAAVAVLVIACPCALGLATPTALLVGTGRGASLGILVKGPEVLESTRRVDTILLDKTGTVTTGAMTLVDVVVAGVAGGVDRADLLRLAGAVEDASEHPVGGAIAAGARAEVGELPPVVDFASVDGLGVTGTVDGRLVVVGRPRLLAERGVVLPAGVAAGGAGRTCVVVAVDGVAIGLLAVADAVKPTSAQAVRELRELGLRPMLLTGDNAAVAQAVAAEVGIPADDVVAEVLPGEKVQVVQRLQAGGRVVAMVGDGVNDAPALAAADLGLSMGTGTDVAIEAGDLTLVRGDLRVAVDAIRLARSTLRTIKGNLFWAFAYNVAGLPLAALGLLNPMIAGAAMAFSSVFVVSNSLRLRRFRGLAT
ncbi:cadmium-translocating P-type ATPase [Solihabitans fulvus]|uniref:Cation-transporting P-type ATPase B n=1 Tax=Solihabitans fulvus TaxID=1892852 RepID=A0A5B2XP49_9PSEU|nr:heavy metal translocating P-type ATPase [Solihabitans fulvus]KAA2264905.1 cadmium-translocating P-type ATPase [Solihabitans fulvus]